MYLAGDLELSDAPEPGITILSRTPAPGFGDYAPLKLGDTVSIHYAARLASAPPGSEPFDSTMRLDEEDGGESGVAVDEEGRVLDPEFFDEGDQGGQSEPFTFKLGAHSVINGLEAAVLGHMSAPGDRVTALMPSGTAYGSLGAGGGVVPPYEDLVFEVELVARA